MMFPPVDGSRTVISQEGKVAIIPEVLGGIIPEVLGGDKYSNKMKTLYPPAPERVVHSGGPIVISRLGHNRDFQGVLK